MTNAMPLGKSDLFCAWLVAMRAEDLTMNSDATQAELEAGRGYETLFVPALFGPWTKHLVNSVGTEAGSETLDIAYGPGVLA